MTSRPPSNDPLCNCLALRQATRYVTGMYDQVLSEAGLRVTQFSILYKLLGLGPMTVNQMSAELVMDRTTLTRNLKPLERDALVTTGPSEHDKRERVIGLTPAGRAKVKAVLPLWRRAQQAFEDNFGAERALELRMLLRAVVETGVHDVENEPS
ncbi:winged helix-turn-helix transcriptional regulator [Massilia sp. TW-1]|jgi:DNA-binding MarR family transcriptional regulator|uniref:Winged helix-turn-helix transcriptional regulator n=1 Tax=Telluria antibiotica TaxID=2717319 RepID=A0ABX0PFV1_9BURK|nr:MarR family winged helix-turn-helix transcriptional regulator [Telluria antibiotica]NIA56301.1 winged helix-turn-helix transcriptional regulator [Telluria antibiotica]